MVCSIKTDECDINYDFFFENNSYLLNISPLGGIAKDATSHQELSMTLIIIQIDLKDVVCVKYSICLNFKTRLKWILTRVHGYFFVVNAIFSFKFLRNSRICSCF